MLRHSSVTISPSRTGSVGPLIIKAAACGQILQIQLIDHNMNGTGGMKACRHKQKIKLLFGQQLQRVLDLVLTFGFRLPAKKMTLKIKNFILVNVP